MASNGSDAQSLDHGIISATLDSPPPSKKQEKRKGHHGYSLDPHLEKKEKKPRVSPTQKVLNVWALIVLAWALYRHFFGTSLPIWADEFLIKPGLFILPLFLYISFRENKNFFIDIWLRKDGLSGDIVFGSIVGLFLFSSGALINFIQFGTLIRPDSVIFSQTDLFSIMNAVAFYFLISVATSFSEEILSRGFLLKRLFSLWNSMYKSILVSSLLYFALRIPILFSNPEMNGFALLQVMLTDLIFSATVSFLYLQSKSLALPIIIHTFYTLSLYIFLT